MDTQDEILVSFVEESLEHLDGIIEDLVLIEEHGANLDKELVNQVFRTLHSIKGASGFFDLKQVQSLSHVMESILDRFRQGTLTPSPESVSPLLDAADLLIRLISDVEASRTVNVDSYLVLLEEVLRGSEGESLEEAKDSPEEPEPVPDSNESEEKQDISIEEALALIAEEEASVSESDSQSEPATDLEPPETEAVLPSMLKPKKDQSIRVNIDLLDKLMVLAGELVLTRNELVRSADSKDENLIQASVQSVSMITSELQEAIMSTRMQTLGNVFSKFKRIVRDISTSLDKSVNLTISGEEVDMDKTIIEAIGDPLTHLIRNSLDHGIEKPAVRLEKGKKEQGSLQLKAFHSAGQVVIEIIDDGAGINYQKVKEKALASKLMSREQLESLSNKEVGQLIFRPGFSTAEEVTDISGRGVGMDVVQRNLSKVGGVIDMDSTPDQGTKISIKLPLTLAIIPSLLVGMDFRTFAIPQVNLIELVRIVEGDTRNRIELIGSGRVLRIRDSIIPVVNLRDLFNQQSHGSQEGTPEIEDLSTRETISVAVVASGDFKYGIIVDELLESAEIVVKPLGKHFAHSREYAGATILGDGAVAMILDIAGIKNVLNLTESHLTHSTQAADQKVREEKQSLLIIKNSPTESFAIPTHLVCRIEKIDSDRIQSVGTSLAVNYLEDTLQLIPLDVVDGIQKREECESFYAIVVKISGLEIGIMASAVDDIINLTTGVDDQSYSRRCVMGTFSYKTRIIQLLDVRELVKFGAPNLDSRIFEHEVSDKQMKILLVEDSKFFQRQIRDALEESDFEVISANDGLEGLDQLKGNSDVDLVVSDVEMPNMDGLEFVRTVRATPNWAQMPVIALTSLSGEDHRRQGIEAGFTEYQVKLDHDLLISACLKYGKNDSRAMH